MFKKFFLAIILVWVYNVNAEYIFCANSEEGKKIITEKKEGVLMATFISENDTIVKNNLEEDYKNIAKEFAEKVNIVVINFTKDEELSSKYSLDRLPSTVVLKNGIPVNGFKGVYPTDAIKQMLKMTLR